MVNTVADGERLRRYLEGVAERPRPEDRVGVSVEMAMFYGRAFEDTYDACITHRTPSPLTTRVINECVFGLAVYRLWLVTVTDLESQHELARMAGHWRRVTEMVLGNG